MARAKATTPPLREPWTIRVLKWDDFQHYKDRDPPWIKLHRRKLLANRAWRELAGPTAKLLIDVWMLAAGDDHGEIHTPLVDIAWNLRLTEEGLLADLQVLAALSFIEVASEAVAACKQTLAADSTLLRSATPETEGETEAEAEQRQSSVASQPAGAEQAQHPDGNGGVPRETPNAYAVLFPLIRQHLWKPDGKCPAEVAGKPWTEDQEGTVIRELAKTYSVSELEVVVLGLGNMLRGLAEPDRPSWLPIGAKASLRAVYRSRSGAAQMVELCRRAYWSVENKRPQKPRAGDAERVGSLLPGVLP